jgi:hypothetical protein
VKVAIASDAKNRLDLHPYIDSEACAIEFRVVRNGRLVCVDVPRETIRRRFGVPDTPHGLLSAYEAHRDEIDAAVLMHASSSGGAGVVQVRPADLE